MEVDKWVKTPKSNDKNFNKKMKEIYTINGIDFSDCAMKKALPDNIKKTSNPIKEFNEKSFMERAKDYMSNKKNVESSKNPNKPATYTEWSEENRVSKLYDIKIIDLTKNIIKKPEKNIINQINNLRNASTTDKQTKNNSGQQTSQMDNLIPNTQKNR